MCGIIGIFNHEQAVTTAVKGLKLLKNRGRDGFGIATDDYLSHSKSISRLKMQPARSCIGHCLHSVVSYVMQPLEGRGKLVANCEIYNWKELNKKHGLQAGNDAELLLRLIEKNGTANIINTLDELDGDYAFAYWGKSELILARDIIGIKPLFYSHSNGFAFASERKVLEQLGYMNISELNPRKVIRCSIKDDSLMVIDRKFFRITPENRSSVGSIKEGLKRKLISAVEKRLPKGKLGILFSGGIDSTLLALICKNLKKDFTCYTTVLDEPGMSVAEDLVYAEKVAHQLGLTLKVRKIRLNEVERYLRLVVPLIEDSNVTKAGVGITFYPACELAKKDSVRVIFSGLGSEEIFAGYQRHKRALDINKECVSGLLKLYERDTYRDDTITMASSLELRVPFLDKDLIDFALKIPGRHKLKDEKEKIILRQVAIELGLDKELAWRRKKAAQYGSKLHRAIEKLTKKAGYRLKSEYLRSLYPKHNLKLGALVSGGKDSIYAMYVMLRQNYAVECLISIKSENPSSYMFHTPAIDMVELQAKAMNIPLVSRRTEGIKESELKDLSHALAAAKSEHDIQGVITGALYSTYQRDRIERICDQLGLKIFSPLWHINQETEMREIIDNGFEFILTSIAADGLDKTWLGRKITYDDIDRLTALNKKIGINIAFEGGEAESLVTDCPLFTKKINIERAYPDMENKYTGSYRIEKARLLSK